MPNPPTNPNINQILRLSLKSSLNFQLSSEDQRKCPNYKGLKLNVVLTKTAKQADTQRKQVLSGLKPLDLNTHLFV